MIRTNNFVRVNEFGEELNYSNLYVRPTTIPYLIDSCYYEPKPWMNSKLQLLEYWIERMALLGYYYNGLSEVDQELYKDDRIQLTFNRQLILAEIATLTPKSTNINEINGDNDWDDNTRDEDTEHTQHLIMYTAGLCDIEDQTACCCDDEPEEVNSFFLGTPYKSTLTREKLREQQANYHAWKQKWTWMSEEELQRQEIYKQLREQPNPTYTNDPRLKHK